MGKRAGMDYTQNGEGAIIAKYFGGFKGMALEIGANDGLTFSNSRGLFEAGWSLALVEPAITPFCKIVGLYDGVGASRAIGDANSLERVFEDGQRVIMVNAAITPTGGPVDFYDSGTHLHKGDTSLLSTTRPEELARWKKSGEVFAKTTVRGITFEALLKETGVNRFDFISIDAEGADYSILEQIDLTAVGCRMLCVEVNTRGDKEFTEYAKKHGLHLHWSCYENRIYTRA